MHAWEAIQKSLDYIENKYTEDIEIDTLATIASLSPYYFQHLFRRLVKLPVNEYIKFRRLAKASEALKNKSKRILDVALDSGFSDHANFTRAFKETYSITPEEFRNCPVILNHFEKPDLLLNYVMIDEDMPLITDGIVIEVTRRKLERPRTVVGIVGEVPIEELPCGQTTGVATAGTIWDDFHSIKLSIPNLLPGGNEFGVLFMGDAREGCCNYLTGAEATKDAFVEGYSSYTLPCGDYVVCCFEAESFKELIESAVFKASQFMGGWLKRHNLTCGDFAAEMYYHDTNYMEQWLPISPSDKRLNRKILWDKTDGTKVPSLETISNYVNSPLWEQLRNHIESTYQSKPVLEYSKCSLQFGWNVKYKKAGRTLCTLYPMEGYFIALVVIGDRERAETEFALPLFTEYLQQLYHQTRTGMGQKWLMIEVADTAVLEDVKQCISIRRGSKSK